MFAVNIMHQKHKALLTLTALPHHKGSNMWNLTPDLTARDHRLDAPSPLGTAGLTARAQKEEPTDQLVARKALPEGTNI